MLSMTMKGLLVATAGAAMLAACGGGNPLGNPPNVVNSAGGGGQNLSFVYFQKCVNPVLVAQLALPTGGTGSCAASGCHDNTNGTGGAFRMQASAAEVDLATTTPDEARASEMYRNFYSAQGSSVIGAPTSSKMLAKPLVQGVLHGGGQIFTNADTPEAKLLAYWIGRPMPQGQDEFSSAAASMFTPADPATGTCNKNPRRGPALDLCRAAVDPAAFAQCSRTGQRACAGGRSLSRDAHRRWPRLSRVPCCRAP
jgi:hypothetical protein